DPGVAAKELVEEEPPERLRRARVPREERALDDFGQVHQREHGPVEVGEVGRQRRALFGGESLHHPALPDRHPKHGRILLESGVDACSPYAPPPALSSAGGRDSLGARMARLKIGFIPIEGGHYWRESLEEVTRAEDLGFDSVWMEEHHAVTDHY